MSEMVERVARAILNDVWGLEESDLLSGTMDHVLAGDNGAGLDLRSVARAAIEAMREPTEDMVRGYEISLAGCQIDNEKNIYRAMIDAALKDAP